MNPILNHFLKRYMRSGNLRLIDHLGNTVTYGDGTGPAITVRFNTAAAERAIALDPALKLGECFMDGEIEVTEGEVYDLIMLAHVNSGTNPAAAAWMQALEKLRSAARRLYQMNTLTRARGNVHRHYDLSAQLYRLFLDPDAQYSCAYFDQPGQTLAGAQLAKKRHIAAKLMVRDDMDVLDIGCGWGGMGLYLAQVAGAKVTGITLSDEQLAVTNARAKRDGLAARAQFHLQDYRGLQGSFDRIVSVGMFEHVGVNHYDTYFRTAAQSLRPEGVMLLHTIGRSDSPGGTNPFIHKHIFPGGYIPAMSEVLRAIEKSGLIVTDIEVLRLHYAQTLHAWREAFMRRRAEAAALYDEAFCRMWEFYLAGSEASFRLGDMVVFQVQMTHRNHGVPITRDYLQAETERLKALEAARGVPGPAWPEDWPEDFPTANGG